jgi:hypothetical protein
MIESGQFSVIVNNSHHACAGAVTPTAVDVCRLLRSSAPSHTGQTMSSGPMTTPMTKLGVKKSLGEDRGEMPVTWAPMSAIPKTTPT